MMHALLPITLALAVGGFRDDNRDGVKLKTDVSAADRDAIHATVSATRVAAARLLEGPLALKGRGRDSITLKVFRLQSEFEDHRLSTRDRQTQDYGAAFYNPGKREITMTWNGGEADAIAALRGQAARQVLFRFSKKPPPWFEEGFVAYFSGLDFDPHGDMISSLNQESLDDARDALAKDLAAPLDELMELDTVDFFGWAGSSNKGYSSKVLIAESWSLLFHLFDGSPKEDADFIAEVTRRLRTGKYKSSALRRLLPSLDERWRATLEDASLEEDAALIRDAWDDLASGETSGARMKASRVLGRNEDHRSARRILAHTCLEEQDFDSAIRAFDWLLEATPDDFDALIGRGTAYLRIAMTEQRDGAVKHALLSGQHAAKVAPPNERYRGLALAADAADAGGDVTGALRFIRDALKQKSLGEKIRNSLRERERELIDRAAEGGRP